MTSRRVRLAVVAVGIAVLTVAVAAVAATFVLGLGSQVSMTGQQSDSRRTAHRT